MDDSEITLLEALHRMCRHKAKRKRIVFEVTFDDGITRKAEFAKRWCLITQNWSYQVQDRQHAPYILYDEREAVSAIMSIPGMELHGNTVKYHIHQK